MDFKLPQIGKPAIPLTHFPTRHQAFIFRAAEFISFAKMAQILDTTVDNVKKTALQMGIKHDCDSDIWLEKGYITIIRSMWHLLPYEQLLSLLNVDSNELAVLLREEDFLDIKLGDKPYCEPLIWRELNEEEMENTVKIKNVMETVSTDGVKPFNFTYIKPEIEFSGKNVFDTRMIYLFSGLYQKAFDVDSHLYCTDEMLESYQKLGINAVWTQGVLFQLTEFPFDKTISQGWQKRLENLKNFTERCNRYGIKLFLYLNEPRTMPSDFFEKYPEMRGYELEKEKVCMCTSVKKVQDYLSDAVEQLCKAAPLIGGFFTITRSENPTNCYSHSVPASCTCPRCSRKSVGEVVGKVMSCIRRGADRVSRDIKVIAWSWGWNEFNHEIINHLPENVILQSQSELYVPVEYCGIKNNVVDYSMANIGPGERALDEWKTAKARGLETSAKVQVNTTWEGSTVPAIPVFDLVEEHMRRLKNEGVRHLMLSWTLGGYPSANLMYAAKYFTRNVKIPEQSPNVKKATELFCKAFKAFPFDIYVLYRGPQNAGPSNPLYETPTGYTATMTCYAYDDIDAWRTVYPRDVFEAQFALLCETWEQGLALLENEPETETVIMAKAAYCLYKSSLNQFRFYMAREKDDYFAMSCLAKEEESLARLMLDLMNKNAAIGFEAANHYYFSKNMICEKIINCNHIIEIMADKMQ